MRWEGQKPSEASRSARTCSTYGTVRARQSPLKLERVRPPRPPRPLAVAGTTLGWAMDAPVASIQWITCKRNGSRPIKGAIRASL